jgi:hypothetical protein
MTRVSQLRRWAKTVQAMRASLLANTFDIALGRTIVNRDILPLDEAILDQADLELLHQMRPRVADDRENPRARR